MGGRGGKVGAGTETHPPFFRYQGVWYVRGENVYQWGESACSGSNTNAADVRGVRGGSWGGTSYVLRF